MIQLTRTRIALLALLGVFAAAGIGYLVQYTVTEKVALEGASVDAGFALAPDGKEAKKAMSGASNKNPAVVIVGPDNKVKGGSDTAGGQAGYVSHNERAATWDD